MSTTHITTRRVKSSHDSSMAYHWEWYSVFEDAEGNLYVTAMHDTKKAAVAAAEAGKGQKFA